MTAILIEAIRAACIPCLHPDGIGQVIDDDTGKVAAMGVGDDSEGEPAFDIEDVGGVDG